MSPCIINQNFVSGGISMKFVLLFVLSALVLSLPSAFAEPVDSIMLFHLSFEDFGFMDEDVIKPSELKTIEDRGITLVSGRFGNGLQMTLTPHWDELFNNSGVDLDMLTSVDFNTRMSKSYKFVSLNEPFLFGAGKVIPRAGAVAF